MSFFTIALRVHILFNVLRSHFLSPSNQLWHKNEPLHFYNEIDAPQTMSVQPTVIILAIAMWWVQADWIAQQVWWLWQPFHGWAGLELCSWKTCHWTAWWHFPQIWCPPPSPMNKNSEAGIRRTRWHADSESDKSKTATDHNNSGNINIHGLWTRGSNCILDAIKSDSKDRSHIQMDPVKSWLNLNGPKEQNIWQPVWNGGGPLLQSVTPLTEWQVKKPERQRSSWTASWKISGVGSTVRWSALSKLIFICPSWLYDHNLVFCNALRCKRQGSHQFWMMVLPPWPWASGMIFKQLALCHRGRHIVLYYFISYCRCFGRHQSSIWNLLVCLGLLFTINWWVVPFIN